MKNFKYYLCTLACAIAVSSCSLDETSYTEIEKGNYMNNATEAENVLLGVYRNMVQDGIYGFHLSLYFTIPSDIAKVTGNSTDGLRLIPSNAYTSSQTEIATTWANLYNAIYSANDFIEALQQKIGTYDETNYKKAAVYMAEARCLRALYYFEVVRWFGHVALITNTEQSRQHPSTFTQADPADVYKFIEADLQYAIDNLPYAIDDNIRSDNSFRLSKGAALGLLTKVYATWAGYPVHDTSKWEDAAKTAKILVESGKHHLLDDYEQLWKNTCNGVWDEEESLIEVSFYAPTVTGVSANDPCGRIGKWNGVQASGIRGVRNAGNWRVIPTFLRDWKDRESDKRWGLSFADYKYGKATDTGEDGVKIVINSSGNIEDAIKDDAKDALKKSYIDNVCPRKWDTEDYVNSANYLIDANLSNINWYILRYADVLLLYAEALNEAGGSRADVLNAIQPLRDRVGMTAKLTDRSDLQTIADRRNFIRKERTVELAFEDHRAWVAGKSRGAEKALARPIYGMEVTKENGKFVYTRKVAQNRVFTEKMYLYPIPEGEVWKTNIENNPGWNN